MATTSAQKEVTELIADIKKTGYKVVSSGRHHKVLDPKGRAVVDDNGPVILSKTPGEARMREMTMHRLIKAGVFKSDPRKEHHQKGNQNGDQDERTKRITSQEVVRRRVEATKAAARERAAQTKRLREKLEPLVVKVGGWADPRSRSGMKIADLGHVVFYWGERRGRVDRFPTADAAIQAVRTLKTGGSVKEKAQVFWESFLDEWDGQPDPAAWFWEQLREAKGLPGPERPQEAAVDLPRRVAGPSVVPIPARAPSASQALLGQPSVAVEAVMLMSVGRDLSEDERRRVLEIGEKVLQFETAAQIAGWDVQREARTAGERG